MKKQLQTAQDYLCRQEVVLAEIIARFEPCAITPRKNYYKTLVNAIIAQQWSGIYGKQLINNRSRRSSVQNLS